MIRVLPPNPDIDHLKNQAKALLKEHRDRDSAALKTLRKLHRFENASDEDIFAAQVALSDVQFALALEYGFKSWEDLRQEVQEMTARQGQAEAPRAGAFRLKDPLPGVAKGVNRFAYGYSMAMQYCGQACDYDTVMGDSGLAFILQADTEHRAWGKPVKQLDIGWWPLDPWGAMVRLEFVGRTCGRELSLLPSNDAEYEADSATAYRKYFHPAVVASLRAGRPAVAAVPPNDIYLVTGCDDGQPPLLGQISCSPEAKIERLKEYPWTVILLGERAEPMDRRQADREALRHALDLARDRLDGRAPANKLSGQAAFRLWASLLRDDEGWGAHFYHANVLGQLKISRRSAVPYLREMAQRHPGSAQSHLLAAAQAYADGLVELDTAKCDKETMGTHDGRERLAQLVERVAQIEDKAAGEMEQAWAAMK